MKKIFLFFTVIISFLLPAQENQVYQNPPPLILELANYERAPSVSMDTKKEYMLLSYRNTYKTLSDLNEQEIRLGGLRINPVTNIASTTNYINDLKIRKIKEKDEIRVKDLPVDAKITNIRWSPNEKKIAFTHTTNKGVELWIIDIVSAQASKLTNANINANLGNPISWFNDNEAILVRMLPAGKPELIDAKKNLPLGPVISNSKGEKAQNRTYADLLKNKTDETNFENMVTSELYKVDLNGKAELFKEKAMYSDTDFSPDGNYLMLTTIQKPFSYIVPYHRFPSKIIVYDKSGKEIKLVNETPLREVLPKGFMATAKGKRDLEWRADKPATIYFVKALDEGDPEMKTDFRDEVFLWNAPFDKEPTPVVKTIQRYAGITWANETLAVLFDSWYDTRNRKTYLFDPSDPAKQPKIISDRNAQDIYSDPGDFATVKNQYGKHILAIENNTAYLLGDGYTKAGQFPFIDEYNLKTQKTKRIYQSVYTDKIETIFTIVDFKKGDVLVQIQSKSEFPNYYLRNIKTKALAQITSFKNPFESIKDIYKELIKYKRKDGVELSGTLYLPVGYDKTKKEKLPLLIWAYPTEYKDKNSAGQTSSNSNEFTFPNYGSFIYWVTKGYVVLDDAAFPIIGEGKTEPNDNFLTQLVDNAEAAINAVDALGYIDKAKVAVGGHSYGAFMTANLLTHSKLFACGIARSGAYNRTLTPFGFQSEQRNFWEIPEIYSKMSPFNSADKMKTPLLLVHGEADNNPGTFTLQTERYFQALKGFGAPVRMVILPKESHGYVAKENIFHLLWEQDRFLEKHLKGK